jgi:hypothetical protein
MIAPGGVARKGFMRGKKPARRGGLAVRFESTARLKRPGCVIFDRLNSRLR